MARIIFFGTPAFARDVLKVIAPNHQVVGIVTQPDRPFGRRQIPKMSEVKEYALLNNIPCFQDAKLDEVLLCNLKSLQADFFIVVAFGQVFPQQFLQFKPCINVHASILPHLRGASPLQEMILEDHKHFGVSIIKMEEQLDSGDILGFGILDSQDDLNLAILSRLLAQLGGQLLNRVLADFDVLQPLKQLHCEATFCKKIKKQQGLIYFENAREVFVRFLAFMPWPGIFLENGLKLLQIKLNQEGCSHREGEILEIRSQSIVVGCRKGSLEIFEVQPASKQKINVLDYLRGRRFSLGDVFC